MPPFRRVPTDRRAHEAEMRRIAERQRIAEQQERLRRNIEQELAKLNTKAWESDGVIPGKNVRFDLDECVKVVKQFEEDRAAGRVVLPKAPPRTRTPPPTKRRKVDGSEKEEEFIPVAKPSKLQPALSTPDFQEPFFKWS